MKLRSAALSDIGKVRRRNEDRILRDEALGLFGVADGVGGLPGGADAAECAVKAISRGFGTRAHRSFGPTELTSLVVDTNQEVLVLGQEISPHIGIGTTLTFGVFRHGKLHIAHVGDSRCYVARNGTITQLTEDHSVENEARLRRARGELVYVSEQNRNALTRCIGQPTPPEVDVIVRTPMPGERYLFVTDGVTRFVRETELADIVESEALPAQILQTIVDLANARGGADNSTAVLVIVDPAK